MADIIIFDTETTGLVKNSSVRLENQPRITEFAGVRIDAKGKEIAQLEFLCNPGIPIDEEITRITGIKPSDVKGKPPFASHVDALKKFFKGAEAVVAHNLSFDMKLVHFDMERAKATWSWPKRKICTVESTEYLKGRRMSLGELHEYLFKEGFDGAHRAMNDVIALKRCFLQLVKTGVIEL